MNTRPFLRRLGATKFGALAPLVFLMPSFLLDANAASLPSGFVEQRLAIGIPSPTNMSVTPDASRILVCEKAGNVRVIKNGTLLSAPMVTVNPDTSGSRGLLAALLDPNFATNHFVYVYFTARTPTVHSRVSRFTTSSTNPDVVLNYSSELILLDLPTLNTTTNIGSDMTFDRDGKLCVVTGDNGFSTKAQALDNTFGKMLRINTDGTIPNDNPYLAQTTGINQTICAIGLRNPCRVVLRAPGWGMLFVNDIGATLNEINAGTHPSARDYGWPTCEGGACTQPSDAFEFGYVKTGASQIAGGAPYEPIHVTFGPDYFEKYFFSDSAAGTIRYLDYEGDGAGTVTNFASGINGPIDLEVDDHGRLYYLEAATGSVVQIRSDSPCSENPTIITQPQDVTANHGAPVTLSLTASSPSGCTLTYQWFEIVGVDGDFDPIPGATGPSVTVTAIHDNDPDNGRFICQVQNGIGSLYSRAATVNTTDTFEAEGLPVENSSGDTVRILSETAASNGKAQMVDSNAVGDYVTFRVPWISAGTYTVKARFKKHPTRGKIQPMIGKIDGSLSNLGSVIDLYASTQAYQEYTLGTWTPTSTSDKQIRFKVTGKNSASSGYTMCIDTVSLIPQ